MVEKTIGQQFVELDAKSRSGGLDVEMRALIDSDTTTDADGNAGMLLNGDTPRKPPAGVRRRKYVRDLLTVVPCGRIVRYVAEVIASESGGATAVAEAGTKPESSFKLGWGEMTVGKVAAWMPATREVFDDDSGLGGWVDGRMKEQLWSAEDDQLLNGTGSAGTVKGFLSWTGILTQTATNNDVPSTIGDAVAQVESKGTLVDGIVINPADYWAARTERHATLPDFTVPFAANGDLFGIPTIRTTRIAAGTALVGNFALGATLREQTPVRIRTSDSHSTYFTANKLAVVAEVEEQLTLHKADYFVAVTLDTTA